MKKVLLYSAFALGTLTMNTGCGDDFLMLTPVTNKSEATLRNAEGVDFLLTGAYSSFNSMLSSAGGMGEASLTNWVWGDIVGGDANKGSTASDQPDLTQLETWSWGTANGYIKNRWDAVYESVKRANAVMSIASAIDDAELPNKAQIIAQAKFIKGFWLFEGIRVYGPAIPYVTVEDYESATDPQVSNVDENGNYVYIWDKVEQDLKDAIADLPETWPDGQQGRVTSWIAKAVLAKFYLYWSSPYDGSEAYGANKWSEAKNLLDDIIASGKDAKGTKYQLAKTYPTLWDYKESDWTGESVFDVQFTFHGTTSQTASPHHTHATQIASALGYGGWGFYQPSYDFVNSHRVDEAGLPLPVEEYQANMLRMVEIKEIPSLDKNGNYQYDKETGEMKMKDAATSDLTVFVDPRLDVNVGRFDVPYLDWGIQDGTNLTGWVRDYNNGGLFVNKKGAGWKAERASAATTNPNSTAINYHIIRFADILLMRAECHLHDGEYAKVIDIVNQIRTRASKGFVAAASGDQYIMDNKVDGTQTTGSAGNYRIGLYPASYANEAQARAALEREMRLEFGMEGHRWFDIARWGTASEVLNAYAKAERPFLAKFVNSYDSSWVYFPIPQAEIQTAMGRFVQTPAWK
ncbi:MAG: RagB/SusD family nutrient uptake outer membrane protein [Alistipes sp.]|nr:RagB/SusD family nutrient uptake outer membrane protein [Alistipes sp.]